MPAYFVGGGLGERFTSSLFDLKDKDKVLREAVVNALSLVLLSIQQKSINSDKNPLGTYSVGYAKKRSEKGLQTDRVDLTSTNQMLSNFKVVDYVDGYALGFDNQFASQKATWNEQRYGSLFVPNKEDNDKVIDIIISRIDKIINKT